MTPKPSIETFSAWLAEYRDKQFHKFGFCTAIPSAPHAPMAVGSAGKIAGIGFPTQPQVTANDDLANCPSSPNRPAVKIHILPVSLIRTKPERDEISPSSPRSWRASNLGINRRSGTDEPAKF